MLIGTSEGLIIMNISTSEMTYLVGNSTSLSKFTNNYITQVFEDSRGLIWVGTREGVNMLNPENDNLDYLTEKTRTVQQQHLRHCRGQEQEHLDHDQQRRDTHCVAAQYGRCHL